MRMPSVCPVVAHGWNIIEYLPLLVPPVWGVGGGANTLLGPGRAGPCGSFLVLEDHAPLCVCVVFGCGWGVVGFWCVSSCRPCACCTSCWGCGGVGVWWWIMVFS